MVHIGQIGCFKTTLQVAAPLLLINVLKLTSHPF